MGAQGPPMVSEIACHVWFFPLSVHISIVLGKGSIAFIRVSKIQNPERVKNTHNPSSFKIFQNLRPS